MSLNQHQFDWSSKQDYSMVIGVSQPSVSNMQARTSKWMNNWKGWRLRNRKYLFQIWTILSRIELTATWSHRWKECLGGQNYQQDYVTCYTDSDTISIFLRKNVEICESHLWCNSRPANKTLLLTAEDPRRQSYFPYLEVNFPLFLQILSG